MQDDFPEQPSSQFVGQRADLSRGLADLKIQVTTLLDIVDVLEKLVEHDRFRYLSKANRNKLLGELLEMAGNTEDSVKAAFRQLKRVRRERPPENFTDTLLVSQLVSSTSIVLDAGSN